MCTAHTSLEADYVKYQNELVEAGLLLPSGVPGVYGLSGVFEGVIEKFEDYVTRMGQDLSPEVFRFPPILNRQSYQRTNHLETFPDLMGSVHSFTGNTKDHAKLMNAKAAGEDWSKGLDATEVMMVPAACYPLYPTATGSLPEGGRLVDLRAFVFRHEPSADPARMQIFRQREYVRLGSPSEALEHRDYWLNRGEEMLRSVGLDVNRVVANDPFFGAGSKLMAVSQREQALKFELEVPVASTEKPTAVTSCNYHLDHFGRSFDIVTADGEVAHTACIGFGLERISLALFKKHGFKTEKWPASVRNVLGL